MITREEIRTGFATLETNEQKAEFCRQHMEQEQELPELYENLVNKDGEKLVWPFNHRRRKTKKLY